MAERFFDRVADVGDEEEDEELDEETGEVRSRSRKNGVNGGMEDSSEEEDEDDDEEALRKVRMCPYVGKLALTSDKGRRRLHRGRRRRGR